MNPGAPPAALHADVRTALSNAFKLGGSLVATWGVALLVRLYLPRYLGPSEFGVYNFADSFALTGVGLLGLGIDAYIQKEIPVRPRHASDFFGGVVALRALLAVGLLALMQAVLAASGRPPEARVLVLIFSLAYLLVLDNANLAAMLQANTTVGSLAVANVTAKVVWAALVGGAMALGARAEAFAAAFVATEALKALVLKRIVQRTMELRFRLDLRATLSVVAASLPFYANSVALSLNRLDVTVLTFMTGDDRQVGFYGAASNLSGLALMLAPLLGSVLMPLLSRAQARSSEQMRWVVRRAAEALLVVGTPVGLLVALGAELWVQWAFGAAYAPAALSLRALAPQFLVTYLAALLSMTMVVSGRGWRLTGISILGVIVNPLLGALLIPPCARWLGPGGAGVGAALGVVGMDLLVSGLMLASLGRDLLDRRVLRVALGALLASLLVAGLHWALAPWGAWRLLLDTAAYLALAPLVGALPWRDLVGLVRELRGARARGNAGV